MQVTLNGKPEEIQGTTVLDLLKIKNIDPQMVAVELNAQMVEREHVATTALKEGDRVEFLFYMGGGAR
jgi:sulfur carrier protein